jgi:DNA modification methylase
MTVLRGDCLAVMPTLEAESVDAIVSDPPYGLAFMGKAWDHGVPGPEFWREALRVAKPGAHLVAFGGTRTYHRLTCAIEDAGWEIRDCLSWLYGSGFPKSHNGAWGGTALKPAWEPIILARKPLTGTVAGNVAQHGTGALNVDGCRIGTEDNLGRPTGAGAFGIINDDGWVPTLDRTSTHPSGRWPANVCLDEEAAGMLDAQTGSQKSGVAVQRNGGGQRIGGNGVYAGSAGLTRNDAGYGDFGGASRFFYTAKASRREREAGLEGMPEKLAAKYANGDGLSGRTMIDGEWQNTDAVRRPTRNSHPTVKPLALMRWVCRLVTPKGGLILDPFTGSGTTGCAAVLEGFRFVGIEREPEYAAIAEKRIAHWAGQVEEPTLFG